jgi:hypothetical protein
LNSEKKNGEFLLCLLYIFAKFAKSNKTCMNSEKNEMARAAGTLPYGSLYATHSDASREASGC